MRDGKESKENPYYSGTINTALPIGLRSQQVQFQRRKTKKHNFTCPKPLYPMTSKKTITLGSWDPQPRSYPQLPHPAQWARGISRILFECIIQRRELDIARKWLDAKAEKQIVHLRSIWDEKEVKNCGGLIKVGNVEAAVIKAGIAEISTTITISTNVHALAFRMEIKNRCWMVTAVETV